VTRVWNEGVWNEDGSCLEFNDTVVTAVTEQSSEPGSLYTATYRQVPFDDGAALALSGLSGVALSGELKSPHKVGVPSSPQESPAVNTEEANEGDEPKVGVDRDVSATVPLFIFSCLLCIPRVFLFSDDIRFSDGFQLRKGGS